MDPDPVSLQYNNQEGVKIKCLQGRNIDKKSASKIFLGGIIPNILFSNNWHESILKGKFYNLKNALAH